MSKLLMQVRKKKQAERTNPWLYCLEIGFFAGLIWGLLHWLLYSLSFTKVIPGYLAEPFFRRTFLVTYWGHAMGIMMYIGFSVAAALLYYLLLGRFKGPWPGLIYGGAWYGGVIIIGAPALKIIGPPNVIGWNTLFTMLSIYLLWGLFIGFSIAFEYHSEAGREPMTIH
ncbi:YqhR family membrane protein [Paenibacillus tarimensis]|uniref:YqhR family membrane protein n=1 Tax=Paenibacillus tarimensis TaxID=416012 RepID=UPI001F16FD9D|nr:YqhR family membrane protein [Paenibacillus tarimensis]MCF2942418.1 YqhR family membrane protein [Paenibacillus tarimensis]